MQKEIPYITCKCRGLFSLGRRLIIPSEMGWEGFEPSTNALKGHCSTTELPTQNYERGYVLPVLVTSKPVSI